LSDSLPIQDTQWTIGEVDEYSKNLTVYFFNRLKDIYITKFSQSFKTEIALKTARREWAKDIGELSKDQVDIGMDKVKKLCSSGNKDFEWPNIALTIGVCRGDYADNSPKSSEAARRQAFDESQERKVSRERWLADTSAQDASKRARDKIMSGLKDKLAG